MNEERGHWRDLCAHDAVSADYRSPGRAEAAPTAFQFKENLMDSYQQGVEQLRQMVGPERMQCIVDRFRALSPAFEQETIAVVFGRTWSREALDRKTRSLCSIGILAALGRQNAMRIVFELAIRNGATLDEITETLLQVAIYGGYPAALDALTTLESVLDGMKTMH
jgi:4-carboxymuconolactone decarboxylase